MKLRVEVDEMGRTIIILPEDLIEDFTIEDGDIIEASLMEDNLLILEI